MVKSPPAVEGTGVRSLVREDPAKPVHHNYVPALWNLSAAPCKATALRSPCTTAREKPMSSNIGPAQLK